MVRKRCHQCLSGRGAELETSILCRRDAQDPAVISQLTIPNIRKQCKYTNTSVKIKGFYIGNEDSGIGRRESPGFASLRS